jgi:hypothetical protein
MAAIMPLPGRPLRPRASQGVHLLDAVHHIGKIDWIMMKHLLFAAPLLALAACNSQPQQPEVVDSNPDPLANEIANAAPVELPPSIRVEKTFRCADGSLVGVVFFNGDKQVNVRVPSTATTPVVLKAPEQGKPYTAEGGWTLTGDDSNVTLTQPEKKAVTCHV